MSAPVDAVRTTGRSELGMSVLLLAAGVLVLVDTLVETGTAGTGLVGPRAVPLVVGALLIVVAVLLAVDVLRGGRGESDGGEDVDPDAGTDLRTVGLLAVVLIGHAALIEVVGFPLAGMLLFWGASWVLGSREPVRDPLIAAALALSAWILLDVALGVSLPAGPLVGVLGNGGL